MTPNSDQPKPNRNFSTKDTKILIFLRVPSCSSWMKKSLLFVQTFQSGITATHQCTTATNQRATAATYTVHGHTLRLRNAEGRTTNAEFHPSSSVFGRQE